MALSFYERGIRWIAEHDEPAEESVDEMSSLVSVCMLADLCQKGESQVALDVLRLRRVRRTAHEAKRFGQK